jgi:DNA-binding LacI/PurR family transcriptional regulator
MRGIEEVVRAAGYDLLISTHAPRPGASHPLGEHNTDGLLVFTDSLSEPELVHLRRVKFPVVLLYQSAPGGLQTPCVTFENKDGARKLVDHLIETHDYRRIGFLAGPPGNEDSYWRELGYRQALEAHGLMFDPALVTTGGFDYQEALDAVAGWLAVGLPLNAIFASDDESASGALEAVRRAGKRVPEDVAIAGFDDVPLSRHLNPPLTTVRAPIEETGREAARQLIHLIRGGRAEPLVLLPTELVIRQSCGCQ